MSLILTTEGIFISELSALIPATDEAEEDGPHELPAGTARQAKMLEAWWVPV